MPYFILACAVVSLLLLGCSSVEERQERAENILDAATENFVQGLETGKRVKQEVTEGISDAAEHIEASALEVQEKTEKLQNGVGKVRDAASDFKEGVTEVRGALH